MLGDEDTEVATAIDEWFGRIHPEDRDRVQRKIEDHLQGLSPRFEDEHRMRHKDGSYRWVLSRGFASRSYHGRPYRMAGAQTDVTDRRAYDPLTGLPNRALFAERLDDALARHRRRKGHFAVLFVDLDHFKAVNDTFGHVAGDQLLVEVARRLEAAVRPGDTVARFAGDEFAILLERIQDVADATGVADRIHRALAAPVLLSDHEAVAVRQRRGGPQPDAATSARRTSCATPTPPCTAPSRRAGGRWEICDEAMRERVASRARMQRDLRQRARAAGALRPLPAGGRPRHRRSCAGSRPSCAGAACCCRSISWWRRRRRRASCASRPGCCARPAPRPDDGGRATGCPFRLSLNVSTTQFLRAELAAELRAALDSSGFPGAALDLEVSEDTLLCDASAVAAAFGAVNALGVGVVLDRFGIGHGLHHRPAPVPAARPQARRQPDLGDGSGDGGVPARRSSGWPPRWPFPSPPPASRRKRSARVCRPWAARKAQGGLFSKPLDAAGGGGDPHARRRQPPLAAARPSVGSTPSAPSP